MPTRAGSCRGFSSLGSAAPPAGEQPESASSRRSIRIARRIHTESIRNDAPQGSADPRRQPLAHQLPRGFAEVCMTGSSIGATGFEPATFRPPVECATRLRHAPWTPMMPDRRRRRGPGRRGRRRRSAPRRSPDVVPAGIAEVVPGIAHGRRERERRTGIEPASSAWKAEALPLSYRRAAPERRGHMLPDGGAQRL